MHVQQITLGLGAYLFAVWFQRVKQKYTISAAKGQDCGGTVSNFSASEIQMMAYTM